MMVYSIVKQLLTNLYSTKPLFKSETRDFPGSTVVKNPPANAGDTGLSPGPKDPTCRGATNPVCHNY